MRRHGVLCDALLNQAFLDLLAWVAAGLLVAAGAAVLTFVIRAFGAYPDGVAFATLLMNILVPIIDMKTQAPVFGHKKD